MAQLRHDYDRFLHKQTEVIVIGPDNMKAFQEYWQKEKLPFIGISDPDAKVLKKYGQEVKLFKLGRMPAQVIVDREGIARFVHYGNSMSDISEDEELFRLLDELNQIAAKNTQPPA